MIGEVKKKTHCIKMSTFIKCIVRLLCINGCLWCNKSIEVFTTICPHLILAYHLLVIQRNNNFTAGLWIIMLMIIIELYCWLFRAQIIQQSTLVSLKLYNKNAEMKVNSPDLVCYEYKHHSEKATSCAWFFFLSISNIRQNNEVGYFIAFPFVSTT